MAIDAEPQEFIPKEPDPTLLKKAQRFLVHAIRPVLSTIVATTMLQANPPQVNADPGSKEQGNELQLKKGVPSLGEYELAKWDHGAWFPDGEIRPLSPGVIGPEGTPQELAKFLEDYPDGIAAMSDVKNKEGVVIAQVAALVNDNKTKICQTKLGTDGLFPDYQTTAELPFNVSALATSSNGKIMVVGGEQNVARGDTRLSVSLDGGINFTENLWNLTARSGAVKDLISLGKVGDEEVFLGNNASSIEDGQFLLLVHPDGQVNLQKIKWNYNDQDDFKPGPAYDLGVISTYPDPKDSTNILVKLASNSAFKLAKGLTFFELNTKDASGKIENLTDFNIDGRVVTNLGGLSGRGIYHGPLGEAHYLVSNPDRQVVYDLEPDKKIGTTIRCANILDNSRIANLDQGSFTVGAIKVIVNRQGEKSIIFGGTYQSTADHNSHAVIVNSRDGKFIDLAPDRLSGIPFQNCLQREVINGYLGFVLNVRNFGKVFVPDDFSAPRIIMGGLGEVI